MLVCRTIFKVTEQYNQTNFPICLVLTVPDCPYQLCTPASTEVYSISYFCVIFLLHMQYCSFIFGTCWHCFISVLYLLYRSNFTCCFSFIISFSYIVFFFIYLYLCFYVIVVHMTKILNPYFLFFFKYSLTR